MLLRAPKIPKYRHHKAKNLAVVTINGKHIYLGRYDSPESWQRYHQLIAEWLEAGRQTPPAPAPAESTYFGVICLVEQYLIHARGYYRKDGRLTNEVKDYVYAAEALCELYGLDDARQAGPRKLKLLQQHMIAKGWARGVINQRINRVRRMFKWAVAEELVPPSVLEGLRAVPGLRYGRTTARETEPVRPVDDAHVNEVGWEFRTYSYPEAGPGGWIQFLADSVPLEHAYIFRLAE